MIFAAAWGASWFVATWLLRQFGVSWGTLYALAAMYGVLGVYIFMAYIK